MNTLYFKNEEEKCEYVQHIVSLTKALENGINELNYAKENVQDLDKMLKKAEDFSYIIYAINNYCQAIRDKYRKGNETLTYAQEKTIIDTLHEVASKFRVGEEYEFTEGGSYELTEANIKHGYHLRREFHKALDDISLDQDEIAFFQEEKKR